MNREQFDIWQRDLEVMIAEHGESLTVTQNEIDSPVQALVHQINGAPDWVREYRKRDETVWFVGRVLGTAFPNGIGDKLTALDETGTKYKVQDFMPIGRPYEGKFIGYLLAMTTNTRLGGL